MIDFGKVVAGMAGSGFASWLLGGAAGGAVASALMGKKGRKAAGTALKLGGAAAIGGLAWKAYQHYRSETGESADASTRHGAHGPANQPPKALTSLPGDWAGIGRDDFEAVVSEADGRDDSRALLLIRAMVSAATADGHIDELERRRIFAETDRLDLDAAHKVVLLEALRDPLTLEELVASTPDRETAIEVYASALLAVDETRPEAAVFLAGLARGLHIPEPLVEALHTGVHGDEVDQDARVA